MSLSRLLVFGQFFSLSMLFWPVSAWPDFLGWSSFVSLLVLAVIFLIWTAKHNRLDNFNIVPEIKEGCSLIQTGPYRFIRHPMYTAVVAIGSGALAFGFTGWKVAVLGTLIFVLYVKARREEGIWCEKTSEYEVYKQRTKMFIPFVL